MMRMGMPKPVKMPGPPPSPGAAAAKPVSAGFGMKHQLRKGTQFKGMSPADTGVSDQMSDYARAMAAKGAL